MFCISSHFTLFLLANDIEDTKLFAKIVSDAVTNLTAAAVPDDHMYSCTSHADFKQSGMFNFIMHLGEHHKALLKSGDFILNRRAQLLTESFIRWQINHGALFLGLLVSHIVTALCWFACVFVQLITNPGLKTS